VRVVVDPNMKLPKLSVAAGAVGGATIRAAASVAHILCSVMGGPPGTQTDAVEALRVYSEAAVGGAADQKFSANHARVYSSVDGLRGGASMPTYELLPALQKEVLDCAAAVQVLFSLFTLRDPMRSTFPPTPGFVKSAGTGVLEGAMGRVRVRVKVRAQLGEHTRCARCRPIGWAHAPPATYCARPLLLWRRVCC